MTSKHYNENYLYKGDYCAHRMFGGLSNDFELLRNTFVSENDMSYKAFAKSWKSLQFSSIFGVQSNFLRMLEFPEGTLHSAKGYIFSQDIESQVFGMYLLQTLYYKQCFNTLNCKIRLSLNEFLEIQKILKIFKAAGFDEAIYIFIKLFKKDAIQFVVLPIETGIEIGFRKYHGRIQGTETPITEPPMEHPVDLALVKQFDETLQIYLKNKEATFKDSDLFSSTSNFVSEMQSRLKNFGEIDLDTTTNTEAVVSDVESFGDGESRRNIKRRAFADPVPSTSKASFNMNKLLDNT